MSDKFSPSGVTFFWKKLSLLQKTVIVGFLAIVFLLPFAFLASRTATRLIPRTSDIQTGQNLVTIPTPTVHIPPVLPGRVPKTPGNITAVCPSTQQIISSNLITDCPGPQFSWESDASGFLLYFGQKPVADIDILKDGVFQTEKIYRPGNLQAGSTYNLFIQEASAEGNSLWVSGGTTDQSSVYQPAFVFINQ